MGQSAFLEIQRWNGGVAVVERESLGTKSGFTLGQMLCEGQSSRTTSGRKLGSCNQELTLKNLTNPAQSLCCVSCVRAEPVGANPPAQVSRKGVSTSETPPPEFTPTSSLLFILISIIFPTEDALSFFPYHPRTENITRLLLILSHKLRECLHPEGVRRKFLTYFTLPLVSRLIKANESVVQSMGTFCGYS